MTDTEILRALKALGADVLTPQPVNLPFDPEATGPLGTDDE